MEIGSVYSHAQGGFAVTIVQVNSLQVKVKRDDTEEEYFVSIDEFNEHYVTLI
ncbi:hypothetical protein CWC29_000710 [Pseudoalteromonas sp. S4498]|uniref:Uncharacterized protein n=1 Tax=Pseudoalteromonas galatheae TaxID=579562 RepID=A0A8T6YJ16_9GAMM|nr:MULTISPECIES: hypothetical protein [Pseudoalteromonas]MCG9759366.1 hypothetical protein [Pseudoalteromonas sp. Isolate6]NKC17373.1 hypothetical protein [Pseudoalteromonas galatheae]